MGSFFYKSFCDFLKGRSHCFLKMIWKALMPPRVAFIARELTLGKYLTLYNVKLPNCCYLCLKGFYGSC